MESQIRRYLNKEERSTAQELNNPLDIEESFRKKEFPEICSAECPHRTCGYYREENFGKPCQMQWKPKETSLDLLIEQAVVKALKPITDRLERLENQTDTSVQRSFNGTPPRIYKASLTEELEYAGED